MGYKQAVCAAKCVMVRYTSSHKGYCFWEPSIKKILITQNVRFDKEQHYTDKSNNDKIDSLIDCEEDP
jgi:hypothetical protein